MDERKDDEDGDPSTISRSSQRRYFSQPLGRDAVATATATAKCSSAIRKHSLDAAVPTITNSISDDDNNTNISSSSGGSTRSISYPHNFNYSSSHPPTYQHHNPNSKSTDSNISNNVEIRYPNPNLPNPLPPAHHAAVVSGGSFSGSFSSCHTNTNSFSDGGDGGGTMTLDRAMSEFGGVPGTLPEFMGTGGGTGIFHVPVRAAMHPGRPPALELRPHPLRETQFGSFLRTIACTDNQLWAGLESGLRFWNLSEVYESGPPGTLKRGDKESAPFRESGKTSPTLCLVVDKACRVVYSGHKDGKIRSWKIDEEAKAIVKNGNGNVNSCVDEDEDGKSTDGGYQFKEGLSWQAHRTSLLCLVITSYGDLWSGSEGGGIKVWPWESIEKSLSLTVGERHMASLLVERSYIDLRSNCTVNGICPLPASDVRHLLSDNGRYKVWSASSQTFALWDARKRELLKVFGIDGQVENRLVEALPPHDSQVEDEMKVKFVSSKKEKSQVSFLQRSRNALIGAADAVRRVAAKGTTFGDENRRTEALIITADGGIWSGCNNGFLIQWDGNGTRLYEVQHHSHAVKSMCTFGTHLWAGYVSGTIAVMDLEGNLLGSWVAYSSPVIKMAVGGFYLFTVANHGGIRGWSLTSPGPIDNILRSEIANKELLFTKQEHLKILCGTWNVGQARASPDSLISWLGSAASEVGLVVVGLQEVEMGAGFLAMAAAKETVGLEGSANGQWWLDTIGRTLGEGKSFERVGSRQLAGLLICAWARRNIRSYIGDVDAAAVACGFGRAIGNKGSVGLRMRVYDRIMCFANCHFAAHLEAVSKRNADFDHIYRTMSFSRPSQGLQPPTGGASSAVPSKRGGSATGSPSDDGKPDLSEADMVVFLGDFNYRLHSLTYDEARDMVSQRCFDWLREKDQLRAEMRAGKVFQGMREGQIRFPPTYKFERHVVGLSGYDSSEKKRIPAWCDRILYRDSRSISVAECSLECPVVGSITLYEACMDVTDSDHKPVRCIFDVEIARVDETIRRKLFGEIILSNEKVKFLLEEYCGVPETIVSTNNIILQNSETSILRITNKCETHKAAFKIVCEGQYARKEGGDASELCVKGSFGFPQWLQVQPAAGVIMPSQIIEVRVNHEEYYTQEAFVDGVPSNWWCEDTRDKEAVLLVYVMGSYSTERKTHRIHVRRCCTPQTLSTDEKGNTSSRVQSNHLHRADFADFESNSADLAQTLCPIRGS